MDDIHVHENDAQSEADSKRRKIRKGTRSCWDCKRRKMKCLFEGSPTSTESVICIGCKKRGSKCVSQEFDIPDELPSPLKRPKGHRQTKWGDDHERVIRVEALLEQLVKKSGDDRTSATSEEGWKVPGNPTDSSSSNCLNSQKLSDGQLAHATIETERECGRIAQDLYESLPSRQDIEILCKARNSFSIFVYEKLTTPYADIHRNGLASPESLLDMPGPYTHPVLVARYMLRVAVFLQVFQPISQKEIEGLSEPPQVMMKRVAETAMRFITANDEIVGSLEGLECIMIDSLYQHNAGNLRRSWIAMRKAMVIAQLMGIHRSGSGVKHKMLDPKTKSNPQFMWFRILFFDRHFCLMLGLPQGSLDRSMADDQMLNNDTPMGRLERMHCDLASRILELNDSDASAHHFAQMQELDEGLQKAARILPPKWWLCPVMTSDDDPLTFFDSMGQLFNQLFHYNLLNQLHLPFMLRSSAEHKHDYSKITCVNASREVLSRFIFFRNLDGGIFICRPLDFFALMAAMTLLLAHLDSHRYPQTGNILAHQYLSDRAMIEQTQEIMEEMSRRDGDSLTPKSEALLRRLLAILGEAINGNTNSVERVSVSVKAPETEMEQPDEMSNSVFRFFVPHCGIIKIAREGLIVSKESPKSQYPKASSMQSGQFSFNETATTEAIKSNGSEQDCMNEVPFLLQPRFAFHQSTPAQHGHSSDPLTDFNISPTQNAPQFATNIPDPLLQQYEFPAMTAGIDDWAFQGVDTAFFNSLMKGVEEDSNGGSEWALWHPES